MITGCEDFPLRVGRAYAAVDDFLAAAKHGGLAEYVFAQCTRDVADVAGQRSTDDGVV